jgi:dTDP-4-dehydrorhamnose 3,5-epimerase
MYNDKDLNIDWQLKEEELILSDKDKNNLTLAQYRKTVGA